MKINGKEIKFAYTIGSYCDYLDYCSKNPDVVMIRANCYKALYMNRAYVAAHEGAESVTIEEIMQLPGSMYAQLMEEVNAVENAGKETSVETVNVKKNVNSKSK